MRGTQEVKGGDALVNPQPVHFLSPPYIFQRLLPHPMRVGILRHIQPVSRLQVCFQVASLLNSYETFVLGMLMRQ